MIGFPSACASISPSNPTTCASPSTVFAAIASVLV